MRTETIRQTREVYAECHIGLSIDGIRAVKAEIETTFGSLLASGLYVLAIETRRGIDTFSIERK